MGVYEKILAIMQEVEHIQKDDQVSYKNTNYKALSEEKVTTIMRKKLIDQKMVVFPIKQEFRKDGYISHVDVTYKIVDTETGESIEVVSCGDGADSQDKGAGKAMTYAYKYMWLRTFAIPTGEDPDKISSAQLDDEQKKAEEKVEKEAGTPKKYKREIEKKAEEMQELLNNGSAERMTVFNNALDYYKVDKVVELTVDEADLIIKRLKETP